MKELLKSLGLSLGVMAIIGLVVWGFVWSMVQLKELIGPGWAFGSLVGLVIFGMLTVFIHDFRTSTSYTDYDSKGRK